jgi:hypothetical protein
MRCDPAPAGLACWSVYVARKPLDRRRRFSLSTTALLRSALVMSRALGPMPVDRIACRRWGRVGGRQGAATVACCRQRWALGTAGGATQTAVQCFRTATEVACLGCVV